MGYRIRTAMLVGGGTKTSPTRLPQLVAETRNTPNDPTARKGLAWSLEEANFLSKLRVDFTLPWSAIHQRFPQKFPGRSKGSLQGYWSTKLKDNLQETRSAEICG